MPRLKIWISKYFLKQVLIGCRIPDSYALIANLYFKYNQLLPNFSDLKRFSNFVGNNSKVYPEYRCHIIGGYAFTHIARLLIDTL